MPIWIPGVHPVMKDSLRNLLGNMSRLGARSGPPDGDAARLGHPTEERFEEYCFNRLPEAEASGFEEHILVCGQCQDQLEEVEVFLGLVKQALQVSNDSEPGNVGQARPSLTHIVTKRAVVNQPKLPTTTSFDGTSGPEQSIYLPPFFSAKDLLVARERLPVSHLIVSRCAESWVENDEDAYDRTEHSFALRCLNLTSRDLRSIRDGDNADLAMLRFAA